jgi:hypothetical protein
MNMAASQQVVRTIPSMDLMTTIMASSSDNLMAVYVWFPISWADVFSMNKDKRRYRQGNLKSVLGMADNKSASQ